MFEPVKSWSLPDHLYLVSGWSAKCKNASPMSCVNNIVGPYGAAQFDRAVDTELRTGTTSVDLAWTDVTWLLFVHHVSWAYYVQTGTQPDCDDDSAETCAPVAQSATTPGIWNPLPLFGDVRADHQLNNVQSLDSYFAAAQAGTLPSVSWITPVSARQRAPSGQRAPGPGLRHLDHQRGHEEPGLGLDALSSWPGTTGAASTTTWCRPRWTRTATGCASPAWSSRPTPSAVHRCLVLLPGLAASDERAMILSRGIPGDELREQHRRAVRRGPVRPGGGHRTAHRDHLRRPGLDRPHVAAVRPPRELGLLRPDGHPAGLVSRGGGPGCGCGCG